MKRFFQGLLTFIIGLGALSFAQAKAVAISSTSQEILLKARQLHLEAVGGGETAKSRQSMMSIPRPKLLQAVREGLNAGGEWATTAAQAARTLKLTEVVSDLQNSVQRSVKTSVQASGDWQLILAIGALANETEEKAISTAWLAELSSFDDTSRLVIYETLGQWNLPLSDDEFNAGISDENFEVRQAVVHEFLQTRAHLGQRQQIDRYRKSFALKPYQVRLSALLDFKNLPVKDRALLSPAVDTKLKTQCLTEDKPEVRTACEAMLKGAK